MAEKESRSANTLAEFLDWAGQFNDGQYLFRGVRKETYEIEASVCRRLPEEYRNDLNRLLRINKRLIEDARSRGHDERDGQRMLDLELLSKLQHFGAATCLMDFTRSALVALWFACEEGTEDENNTNGKVLAVRRDVSLKTVDSDLLQQPIDHFFQVDKKNEYQLYQWEPKLQNNRIIAQRSVFVFGVATIKVEAKCVVLHSSKQAILKALNEVSDIAEASMYPDFDGFARLHAHNRPSSEPNPQGYLQRGIEALQRDDWDTAIEYYNQVILLEPESFILVQAYNNRGIAHNSKREFDLAIEDFNQTIKLNSADAGTYFNRAFAYGEKGNHDQAIDDYTKTLELQPANAFAYYNRGVAYGAKGNHDLAIGDYDKVVALQPAYTSAYHNRGFSYYSNGNWDKAVLDFSKAIELKPGNPNAYSCRGDAYRKRGLPEKAILDYTMAIGLNPNHSWSYYGRGEARLRLAQWDGARSDLKIAVEKGVDVIGAFSHNYETVPAFNKRNNVQLPPDIATMLTPPGD